MSLVLHCVALNDAPMSRSLSGRFDQRGGTLGRSDSATFTLSDPERSISRIQAKVLYWDDGYWLENISAASPILHNGRPLSPGMRVVLRADDEIRIGGYTLLAAFEDDETSETILRGRTATSPGRTPAHTPPDEYRRAAAPAPPLRAAPPLDSTPHSTPTSPPAAATGAETLRRAFLEGAGLDPGAVPAASAEWFASAGTMLRVAVGGIHRLIAMRALAKDQMQAQMTAIQLSGNNPLKFAPDELIALQLLLQPPARGFLGGSAALQDALVDLQSHEVGVMAGMRSALEEVLERFDPSKLEASLTTRTLLDALVPANRRSRLWELYVEHYRSLRAEAREDFERFFGEAFREAYEAQVRSLEAGDPGAAERAPPAGYSRGGKR